MLQDLLGTRQRAQRFYERQVLSHLSEAMRSFIGQQQMMFLASSDTRGTCDSTLRAGPPGFVVVLDVQRIAWPEYRGNGVMASRGNITKNPHVGLLFVDFVRDVIGLHVNGSANLVDDAELRRDFPALPADTVPGRRPEHWVVTQVEEAYIHCAKYIPRLYAESRDGKDLLAGPQPKKSDYFTAVGECGGSSFPDGSPERASAASEDALHDRPTLTRPPMSSLPPVICRPVPISPASDVHRASAPGWRRRLLCILLRQLRRSW
jgi:predicted pyridoxine 5'-phosphate oxidase superfamily flavin-nucleotide-binding protein